MPGQWLGPALISQGKVVVTSSNGEVYALNTPASTLKWLDAYDGIVPGKHASNEYERVERDVRLASGPSMTAWVYLYRGDVSRFRFIADGRWVAFTSRTQHERYRAQGAADGDTSWQAPRKIERFFTRLDNEGWVYDRPSHVYVARVDGSDTRKVSGTLVAGGSVSFQFRWAPDSSRIAFVDPSATENCLIELAELPAGDINHHWTKNIIASPAGELIDSAVPEQHIASIASINHIVDGSACQHIIAGKSSNPAIDILAVQRVESRCADQLQSIR